MNGCFGATNGENSDDQGARAVQRNIHERPNTDTRAKLPLVLRLCYTIRTFNIVQVRITFWRRRREKNLIISRFAWSFISNTFTAHHLPMTQCATMNHPHVLQWFRSFNGQIAFFSSQFVFAHFQLEEFQEGFQVFERRDLEAISDVRASRLPRIVCSYLVCSTLRSDGFHHVFSYDHPWRNSVGKGHSWSIASIDIYAQNTQSNVPALAVHRSPTACR